MYVESKWKASQFNEFLGKINDNWILYNNLSGAMVELNKGMYDSILNNRVSDFANPTTYKALEHGKFIVDGSTDEIEEIKRTKDEMYRSVKVIGLQILPTLSCNFGCVYCYEKRDNRSQFELMSEGVMDSIVDFVNRKIKQTTRYLYFSFFGGEPLIAAKQIDHLAKAFLEVAEKNDIKTFSNIVTNGYLLTGKNVDMLVKNKIIHCQVSVDGPEKIHDSRRMLTNGGKTWRRIIDNVKYAVSKDMDVKIRMNIDKSNMGSIEEFISDLEKNEILDRIEFSIGIVSHFGNACKSIEDTLLTLPKARQLLKQKNIERMVNKSKRELSRTMPDLFGCVATSKNSLIVGPRGELYKCSKTVGDLTEQCGNISDFDPTHPVFEKWGDVDNLNSEKCRRCTMVPVCKGSGCEFDFLVKNKGISDCDQEKEHSEYLEHLRNLYKQKLTIGD